MGASRSFSGGCACRAVRYSCSEEPLAMVKCHCRDCQYSSGTGHSSIVAVPKSAVEGKGRVKYYTVISHSGSKVKRGFCPECGSPLFADSSANPAFLGIKAASLDDPSWFKPSVNLWLESKQNWDLFDDAKTSFQRDFGAE